MNYRLKVYSIWEAGQRTDAHGDPHQEDSLSPAFGSENDSCRTFILCDGMGGHDAGEVASRAVCEAMSREDRSGGTFSDNDFDRMLQAAYDLLDSRDNGSEKKMGTTLAFLRLHDKGATVAHIGDSRVYHIRPGETGDDTRILFHTEDHSLVNELVKAGEMTPEEARNSGRKNVITRAMQPNLGRRPKADIRHIADIRPGDYFYLCSDGMLEEPDMENGTSLRNIFSARGGDAARKKEILRGATAANRDNHSAFIIEIIDVKGDAAPAPLPATHAMPSGRPDKSGKTDKSNNNDSSDTRRRINVPAIIIGVVLAAAITIFGIWGIRSCSSPRDAARHHVNHQPNTGLFHFESDSAKMGYHPQEAAEEPHDETDQSEHANGVVEKMKEKVRR